LIALREITGKSIVASSYADTLGVPALFTRSIFEELLSLNDKAGAKSIVCEVESLLRHCHSRRRD
jgi:molybdenum cofactor cytidylyltransferase